MKPLEFVVILLCVLLGLGRGADLAFATDAATGLCTAGAVWWRYLALGAVVLQDGAVHTAYSGAAIFAQVCAALEAAG